MINTSLSREEIGICLLAIERQNTYQDLLMKGDSWYSGDPSVLKRLETKLVSMLKGD